MRMGPACRSACRCRHVPLYLSTWMAVLYFLTILGMRKLLTPTHLFGVEVNVAHYDDLNNAVELAERASLRQPQTGSAPAGGVEKVAYLFLLKNKLDYVAIWQKFFAGGDPAEYSIYFHFFDQSSSGKELREATLAAFAGSQEAPAMTTKWCELMAAMESLYVSAYDDRANVKFVLLSQVVRRTLSCS